jgi:hypothetical protein
MNIWTVHLCLSMRPPEVMTSLYKPNPRMTEKLLMRMKILQSITNSTISTAHQPKRTKLGSATAWTPTPKWNRTSPVGAS